jgi:predicted transposase YbfD/YdcC
MFLHHQEGATFARGHEYKRRHATTARLTLAQTCVPEKTNEITAIPDLLDELAEIGQLEGALITIDAMGCQIGIADKIVAHKVDYLLALKANQPTLETDVEDYFRTAPTAKLVSKTTVEKGHGRIETRLYIASDEVDWIASDRKYPGEPRFTNIKTVVKVDSRTEYSDRSTDTRFYISVDIERIARATRGHWGVEHWLFDVEFKDDLSRYRTPSPMQAPDASHLAANPIFRRFAPIHGPQC